MQKASVFTLPMGAFSVITIELLLTQFFLLQRQHYGRTTEAFRTYKKKS